MMNGEKYKYIVEVEEVTMTDGTTRFAIPGLIGDTEYSILPVGGKDQVVVSIDAIKHWVPLTSDRAASEAFSYGYRSAKEILAQRSGRDAADDIDTHISYLAGDAKLKEKLEELKKKYEILLGKYIDRRDKLMNAENELKSMSADLERSKTSYADLCKRFKIMHDAMTEMSGLEKEHKDDQGGYSQAKHELSRYSGLNPFDNTLNQHVGEIRRIGQEDILKELAQESGLGPEIAAAEHIKAIKHDARIEAKKEIFEKLKSYSNIDSDVVGNHAVAIFKNAQDACKTIADSQIMKDISVFSHINPSAPLSQHMQVIRNSGTMSVKKELSEVSELPDVMDTKAHIIAIARKAQSSYSLEVLDKIGEVLMNTPCTP